MVGWFLEQLMRVAICPMTHPVGLVALTHKVEVWINEIEAVGEKVDHCALRLS
ncbi:MAG: hypothetical protein KatS3mg015_2434 [Fimbriimonadales bacterium]|nr:MAG: hypothetical protein KatS3mg015_2434 [Fimbriimonadales bacterium]